MNKSEHATQAFKMAVIIGFNWSLVTITSRPAPDVLCSRQPNCWFHSGTGSPGWKTITWLWKQRTGARVGTGTVNHCGRNLHRPKTRTWLALAEIEWYHWRQRITLHAASSGPTKGFMLLFSRMQNISWRPVNTRLKTGGDIPVTKYPRTEITRQSHKLFGRSALHKNHRTCKV